MSVKPASSNSTPAAGADTNIIPAGTLIYYRYEVQSVLGRGGFGQTYLVHDRHRFNTPCALKELVPPKTEASAISKEQELFEREASVLHRIDHPQIPKLLTYMQDGELWFLVE